MPFYHSKLKSYLDKNARGQREVFVALDADFHRRLCDVRCLFARIFRFCFRSLQ